MNLVRQFFETVPLYFDLQGCGDNFNQSFGTILWSKSNYGELQCNWTIESVGITNAVILLSTRELGIDNRFYQCWR